MDRNQPEQQVQPEDLHWPFWPALPLYPYGRRRTLRREVVPGAVWTFEQVQGILYVVVPIRMTVVKLDEGGLLVYAPVAPTPECLRLLGELVAEYGDVKYIILPTASGLEHKVFVGPFARYFPAAQVFVAPDQWSFPLNLPLSWLGLPSKRTSLLPADSSQAPFGQQFDYALLGPINLGVGAFEEVAVFDKRSRSLLVTDIVVSLPPEAPEIVQQESYALLFHARNSPFEAIADTPENRRRGWQRICLFAFYFRPSALVTGNWAKVVKDAFQAPDRSKKAYFGLFPFQWQASWQQSFQALQADGRLLVAPILRRLILNRAPQETLAWANRVAEWNFEQIIPCHMSAPVRAKPQQFRQAFAFLEPAGDRSLPEEDFALLDSIDQSLTKSGLVPPAQI